LSSTKKKALKLIEALYFKKIA